MDEPPEIKLIARSAADEAAEELTAEMGREATGLAHGRRIVNGAGAAKLPVAAVRRFVIKQPQDCSMATAVRSAW